MALNLLNDLSLNEYLTDISYQGRTVPKQQGIHGEFESADYVLSHTDEIARGILNQYIKHRVREYILKQGNEPAFVPVDANRPDLPDWAKNVLARGEAVYEFDGTRMSDNLKNDITTVRDYLYDIATTYVDKVGTTAKNTKRKPKIRYDFLKTNNEYQTFEMALSAAHAWHEKIAAGLKDRLKSKEMLEKSLQGVEFVMELPGNMAAYKLTTSAALDFESEYMGHCVGSGGYDNGVADGTTQIYSIRDERGEPHVTFEVRGNSIKQVKGKQNKRPVAKYMPAVQAFVHANNFDIDGDIKNTGLIKQDGKYYDIFHLPRGFVIHGDLDLSDMDLTMLPDMSNVIVQGDFDCRRNELTSLQGAPQSVGGKFDCSFNQLTSLQGAPQSVGGDFICRSNQLTSLQGAPQSVGGDFNCCYNKLTSLQGAPQSVGGGFNCSSNQLTSLQGAPQSVGGYFNCSSNQLTSLQGAPQSVGMGFYCSFNQLTSLQGAPQSVGGDFNCGSNQLTSLQGSPQIVGGDFACCFNQLTSLQGSPQIVGGYFSCTDNQLTSLQGAPQSVGGDFDCDDNKLTSLQGAPQSVGGKFYCCHNKLTSLQGAPQSVGRDFYCTDNQLTSLQGAPQSVDGNFSCTNNQLTSLQGVPQSVGGDFDCGNNQLTSLQGAPQSVGGKFYCSYNKLTSLQGAPQSVGGNFNCNDNQLTSLQGAPQSVDGDFICSYNQLTSLQGAPQSVDGNFSCTNNQLTSLQGAPQSVGGDFACYGNQLTSVQGAPQQIGMNFMCDDKLLEQEYQKMILERESQDKKCSIKFKNAIAKLLAKKQQLSKLDSGHDI